MTDGVECGYCGTDTLTYEMHSDRGVVNRCIACLALEQGQPPGPEMLDSYDEDLREASLTSSRAYLTILCRVRQDDPILLRDEDDIELKMINMGGGFPANYITRTNDLETYAREIQRFIVEDFGKDFPEIIIEPGRSLISNAVILVSDVLLISRKSPTALHRWVFTDVGKFSGLIETLDEAIKFPIYVEKQGELEESVIAGPTCDSADIMYENHKYAMPLNLAIGDRMYWLSTGAYTTSYSAIEFNGFPPLKEYCI
jgi:diaminopimelate decarboxylase